jgi:hypothetical protein
MNESRITQNEMEKDPQTLEREIDQTRAAMNQTLDRLERKLTAGQLLDECLKFLGKSGGELGRSLGNSVKENPIPALLTATGIAWMMFSRGRASSTRSYDYDSDIGYGETEYAETEEGTVSKMSGMIKSGATSARDQLQTSKDAVKDTLYKGTGAVKDSVSRTADAVRGKIGRTADLAQLQGRRAREGFNSLMEEQPLILGALGIALGAAIGAALPSTEQEDRMMGETRDKTLGKVKERGAETFERARETVQKTAEDVRRAATELDHSSPGESRS